MIPLVWRRPLTVLIMFRSRICFLSCITFSLASAGSNGIVSSINQDRATLRNGNLEVALDLDTVTFGGHSFEEPGCGFENAIAKTDVSSPTDSILAVAAITRKGRDPLGSHSTLEVTFEREAKVSEILQLRLYEDQSFLALRMGVRNHAAKDVRLFKFSPFSEARVFVEQVDSSSLRFLDGMAGGGATQVTADQELRSPNNLIATFATDGVRRSLVIGGLSYEDFAKYAQAIIAEDGKSLIASIEASDPSGRLIRAGETYLPNDWFYIDFVTNDPFLSLENYGKAVAAKMNASPNLYDFPTVCAWYTSMPIYGGGPDINHTTGIVEEAETIAKSGFLKYARAAVRLVPDTYYVKPVQRWFDKRSPDIVAALGSPDANTEQGWWDDEHWRKYGHYREPYETTAKWCKATENRGALPFNYIQTGLFSRDFALAHPEYMLRNDISELDRPYEGHNPWVTYDYTDPGFQKHLKQVWSNLGQGGVRGVMFDYPHLAWREEGGFEDPSATTASAYLEAFRLAREGLGPEAYIHERNVKREFPFLDITAGLVDSQRVWGDTDQADPEMYSRCGLRWYKKGTLFSYDADAKNLLKVRPPNRDGVRQVLTMLYVTSGRLLLGTSFEQLTPEILEDLGRVYPVHQERKSARPIDAFSIEGHPRIYDYEINKDWHQLTLFNPNYEEENTIEVDLGRRPSFGGLGFQAKKKYYIYDFWNDRFEGMILGSGVLEQTLRPGEARMLSLRRVLQKPQVIATKRHVMQGLVDMPSVSWVETRNELIGTARVIAGEPYRFILALNGHHPLDVETTSGHGWIEVNEDQEEIIEVVLFSRTSRELDWKVRFASSRQ